MSKAPWTPEQVAALNRFQQGRWMHPFTCGSGRRTDADHKDGEGLVATENGWICPFCDYTQDWAHPFMFQPCPWPGCISCMIAEARQKSSIEGSMVDQNNQSEEALKQGSCHTDDECAQMYKDLTPEIKAPALEMLRTELNSVTLEIRAAHAAAPKDWYVQYHFHWGMAVRNLLREKRFGEEYFHVHNLDDIYVALVEEALNLQDNIPQGL